MYLKILCFVVFMVKTEAQIAGIGGNSDDSFKNVFDQELYERVVDDELCYEQLDYISNNTELMLLFLDVSGKIPSGIFSGNLVDLGQYHECLNIKHVNDSVDLEGKYCMMEIPLQLDQQLLQSAVAWNTPALPSVEYPEITNVFPQLSTDTINDIRKVETVQRYAQVMTGQRTVSGATTAISVTLGSCVPKVCSSARAVEYLFRGTIGDFILNSTNITYNEQFCRLPNDKQISIADYMALVIFSFLALITVVSTSYDFLQTFVFKKKSTEISPLFRCFSVYTNTKRFLTFNKFPGSLECVDGIRAISMLWVVVGHVYSNTMSVRLQNPRAIVEWLTSFSSTWINSAPITVDTFFLLSGILCVYTVIGKSNLRRFITSLHFFYIYRILRILPLLAAVILLQASVFHRLSDGPMWSSMGNMVYTCRERWWSALLHIQNYVKPTEICLGQTWYLSVDLQLYLASPVVLVWLFGRRLIAWCAISAAVLVSLVLSTTFSFIYDYPAALANPARMGELADYFVDYYMNTLTRASPFAVGMMYGYLLHVCKGKKIRLSKILVWTLWIFAFLLMAFCIFTIYPIMQIDYHKQTFDNFLNSYMRGLWALAVGWMIFACVHGYGGPVNWFLSLEIWKLPSRLSYAMYLIHFPLIMVANSSMVTTYYFTDGNTMYRAMSDLVFTAMAAFILSVTIDAPFSTIQKLLFGGAGGKKTPQGQRIAESQDTQVVKKL